MDWTGTDPDTASNLAPLTLVEQPSDGGDVAVRDPRPEAVALAVGLDGVSIATLAERTSPDRDYLWLDHLAGPIELTAGAHTIELAYAGLDASGESVVDGLWLIPRPLQRTWQLVDGSVVTLVMDPATGALQLQP